MSEQAVFERLLPEDQSDKGADKAIIATAPANFLGIIYHHTLEYQSVFADLANFVLAIAEAVGKKSGVLFPVIVAPSDPV